jgi:hypothetical protein
VVAGVVAVPAAGFSAALGRRFSLLLIRKPNVVVDKRPAPQDRKRPLFPEKNDDLSRIEGRVYQHPTSGGWRQFATSGSNM